MEGQSLSRNISNCNVFKFRVSRGTYSKVESGLRQKEFILRRMIILHLINLINLSSLTRNLRNGNLAM